MLKNNNNFKNSLNTICFIKLFYNKKLDLYKIKSTFNHDKKFKKCDYISGDFNISELDSQYNRVKLILKTENLYWVEQFIFFNNGDYIMEKILEICLYTGSSELVDLDDKLKDYLEDIKLWNKNSYYNGEKEVWLGEEFMYIKLQLCVVGVKVKKMLLVIF